MNTAFAFLDSRFIVPQHLQIQTFNNFSKVNDINISFYGNEPVGSEFKHLLFLDYLESSKDNGYLFFTIEQLTLKNGFLNEELITFALKKSVNLYFANEQCKITSIPEMREIQLLLYSKNLSLNFEKQY
tara:strand:+ start:105 stop:491 length:387 start_codon:yes stop_codon:yes gene_type:complete